MKGFAAAPPRDGVSTLQGNGPSAKQGPDTSPTSKKRDGSRLATTDSERRNGLPLTSPSTTSLQSSSTAGPRSRIYRTLSRPRWLDVDANGGLLKRKTEPALATVTVKGADSIGIKRRDEVQRRGEDAKGKGKEKPQMRKAATMDTISTPRLKALPSPRRRVSQSPLYTSSGATTSDPSHLDDEQQEVIQSPEQEEPKQLIEGQHGETEGSSGKTGTFPGVSNAIDGANTLRVTQEPNSKSPEGSEEAGMENAEGEVSGRETDGIVTAQQDPADNSSAQDSRLWTWGKWAYTYVPAVRRPAMVATLASEPKAVVPTESESASALPDVEQLEETGINETIGSLPASDAKELIYDTASADEALGIETEQGIGVDPAHRSEVPFFTDNRTSAESKGTWSLTGLAVSAWNWRSGAENASAVTLGGESLPSPTVLPTEDAQETGAAGEHTPLAEVEQPVESPSGPQAAIEPATLTANLSALEDTNIADPLPKAEHAEDIPTLSRSAWAFSAASQWIPRKVSDIDHASTQKRAADVSTREPEGPFTGLDGTPVISDVQKHTPVKKAVTATPQSQPGVIPSASALPVALTPEALEARPSPLLPSSASMVATTRPNLVLPSFNHTFRRPPRGHPEQANVNLANDDHENNRKRMSDKATTTPHVRPASPPNMAWRALDAVSHYARGGSRDGGIPATARAIDARTNIDHEQTMLPIVTSSGKDQWKGVRRIVIIGVHGWFPNAHVQKVIGAPRGSSYFASMMGQAVLAQFEADFGVGQEAPEKVTYIPLDGEGTVQVRVEKLFKAYLSRPDWIRDVRRADAIFVAAHSQGTVVATHLLSRLINQGHIRTAHNAEAVERCEWAFGAIAQSGSTPRGKPHTTSRNRNPRIGLLALCGVHQGPFYSSTTSTVIQPYLNWFENAAARELFDFQDGHSVVVTEYTKALDTILHHGVKTIFLASLDDQMVPIYSATFAAASHPLILRLLYVDAAIHSSTDFMINLIVFCIMLRNAGLDDQGLIGHLSEATAGAWRGAGHSTPYEDPGAYAFMVKYLLSTDSTVDVPLPELKVEDFTVRDAKNDYELPWILRGVMDDPDVKVLFDAEIAELKENILSWNPSTRALRDMKKRLEPMAGRTALRQHQQKERLQRSSSFLSLASSEGQAARRQDELSSSPRDDGISKKGLNVMVPTVMNADW